MSIWFTDVSYFAWPFNFQVWSKYNLLIVITQHRQPLPDNKVPDHHNQRNSRKLRMSPQRLHTWMWNSKCQARWRSSRLLLWHAQMQYQRIHLRMRPSNTSSSWQWTTNICFLFDDVNAENAFLGHSMTIGHQIM